MTDATRLKSLKAALVIVGIIFIAGIYLLGIVWPSGWVWHPGQSDYLMMIIGVYATLGVFLLVAARDPLAHRSLIWFTVWSSVVHGLIMHDRSYLRRTIELYAAILDQVHAALERGLVTQEEVRAAVDVDRIGLAYTPDAGLSSSFHRWVGVLSKKAMQEALDGAADVK